MNEYIKEHLVGTAPDLFTCLKYIKRCANKEHIEGKIPQFFYRGEDKDHGFSSLESRLYRNITEHEKCMEYGGIDLYEYIAREFHRDINTRDKRKTSDFMAYCQHHGLPTPLLDITYSLLVGIYFACCRDFNDSGYLYIFNKNRFIDYPSDYLTYKDYFINFHVLNPFYDLKRLGRVLTYYNNEHTLTDRSILEHKFVNDFNYYYDNTILFYKCLDHKTWKPIEKLYDFKSLTKLHYYLLNAVKHYEDANFNSDILVNYYIDYLKKCKLIHSLEELKDGLKVELSPVVINAFSKANLCVFYIYMSREFNKYIQKTYHDGYGLKGFIPSHLLFCIKTNYEWDRVQAQKGLFILEIPFSTDYGPGDLCPKEHRASKYSDIGDKNLRIINNVTPDYVIKLSDKRHIMKELDTMGINCASLFKDADNKATYIWDKYTHNGL